MVPHHGLHSQQWQLDHDALICILLAKEPWNAGHGQVMKAWQSLPAILLEMVVDGDKIFQGVSEATLKEVSVIS